MRRFLVVTILVVSACGAAESSGPGAVPPPRATLPPTATVASAASTTSTTTTTSFDVTSVEDCDADRRTLEVAAEAFFAEHGRYPVGQDELVGDYLRGPITSHELLADGVVGRVPGAPCTTLAIEPIPTVEEILADFGDEAIESLGGPDCARQLAVLAHAATVRERETRDELDRIDELEPYLTEPVTLWTLEGDRLTGSPGSGCRIPDDPPEHCAIGRKTLEVAAEAYEALFGEPAPDQQTLLDADLLRAPIDGFTVTDGDVAADPGGECADTPD